MSRKQAEVEESIKQVLAEKVTPKLQFHRGNAEFVSFDPDNGIATIRFLGTCQGCPLSAMTLKMGVESELLDAVPEVQEVRAEGVDEESLEFIGEE